MCLRDNGHLDYRDSIIGAVQAWLNDGLVYFQCYPNFMVRLRDVDILDSVVLHVKTHEFKFKEGNSPISIITRLAYKSMTTSVGFGTLWYQSWVSMVSKPWEGKSGFVLSF